MSSPLPAPVNSLAALSARGLRYQVAGRTILDELDLAIPPGTSVAITGPSGCGKSTLLNCLAGIALPSAGTVTIAGHDITAASPPAGPHCGWPTSGWSTSSASCYPS